MTFKSLGIHHNLVELLKKQGIHAPTPIQSQSIPHLLEGKDLIGQAPTGTGKTLAFLLPILDQIDVNKPVIQGLIITPTRELALQITQEANKLAEPLDIQILSVYGGKDTASQIRKLKKNIHLIIATPGRLLDHLSQGSVQLKNLKHLVLDEADQMLFMGFRNDIDQILRYAPKHYQMICFSATMDAPVKKLAYRYMKEPIVVTSKKDKITLDCIVQEVVKTTDRHKQASLFAVLDEDRPFMAIIFCRTKRRVDTLYEAMKKNGYNCSKLHKDILQSKRERIMKSFKKGDLQYLIATDVASRGIDATGVTHIYNYDIPESIESYIHRIGRTGRAGETGYTCLFMDPKNQKEFEAIQKAVPQTIQVRTIKRD